jgi:hypothetical protein
LGCVSQGNRQKAIIRWPPGFADGAKRLRLSGDTLTRMPGDESNAVWIPETGMASLSANAVVAT